ncbi:aldo/keto reductase [Myxacorys almedinensis A]|uniref:Aldo/keto reductase n=1 Tax=Myxacorys almedinensis A TaxID=2690445 RepID=A0A8J7Z7Y8_9CYAN|nr:aldo/keto reductase [Myxacorys almedinensis]NDJ17160.1 aldo/keto reductase [Myxacorys almedinensis A]
MTLGTTDVTVPPLAIGTWAWGDSLFWGYGKEYSEPQLKEAFDAAIASGVNFFDTAEIYGLGNSERFLGQFMKQTEQPVSIASKYMPLPWRFSAQSVHDAITDSLNRLQVEHIALYQVHMPFDFFMGKKTLMEALAAEVKRGRIGAIGVSNYSAQQMREAHGYLAAQGVSLAVNQVRYALINREIETNGILDTARELEVTILAYSPLAQGLLTGKYTPDNADTVTGARKFDPKFSRHGLARLSPIIQKLQQIGDTYDRTPAQVALNWLMAQGNVIPLPGAKNAEQARQNAGAIGWAMTDEEWTQIDLLTRSYR